ncbi:T9SS type A sorting domain-containing protein, partial [Psychroserpens sp. XS_ASV72]|uniref:T9SS type A sorting domain-containing protein n=1 Tax=Psychroserpens sp. XS_ASV72 TaxID=3241293 RepID=UPI003514E336
ANIMCSMAADFEAANATYSNGLEGTACEISGEIEAVVVKDYDACGGTITITYNGKDECDRDLEAGPFVITVDPAPEAEVTAPQFPLDIECVDAEGFEAANATYSNGLEETACEISGEIEAVVVKDYDACGGTITITYNGKDECERDLEAGPYTIEVKPAPAPVFDEIDDDSIACEDLASYVPEFLGYSNGIEGPCGINGEVQGVAEPFDGSCGTFEVNFSYVSCGVEITAKQIITVIDETAPMLLEPGSLPQGLSDVNACLADAPAPPTEEEIEALYSDNCGNVNATLEIVSPQENTDCLWAVLYRFTIQDDCGNFAAPVKIYHNGGDQSAPELVGELPEGVSGLQCLSENPGAPSLDAIQAAYTDNCGDVIITPYEPVIEGDDCGWTATYEYEIKDSCGNKLPNLVIENSGADTMPPTLDGEIPMGQNSVNACIDSDLGEPTEEEIAELFSDNCTEITADNVTKVEKLAIGSDCEWIRVFEYTVADDCGNEYPVFKVNYQGGDTEAPTFEVFPEDITIECSEVENLELFTILQYLDANEVPFPVAVDNCSVTLEYMPDVVEGPQECPTVAVCTKKFIATDGCGNSTERTLTVTIIDTEGPIIECPEDIDFGIVDEAPTEFADKATWVDCQGSGETADYSDSEITETVASSTSGEYLFTFEEGYILNLGNGPTGMMNDYPVYEGVITSLGGDLLPQYGTFQVVYNPGEGHYEVLQDFGDGPFVAGIASADAFENCDAQGFEFYSTDGHNKAFTLQCPVTSTTTTYTFIREFTATDACGNSSKCDVTYTWTIEEGCDDDAPVLDCPADEDFGMVYYDPTSFATSVSYTDNEGSGVTGDYTDSAITETYTTYYDGTLTIECWYAGSVFSTWTYSKVGVDNDGYAIYEGTNSNTGSTLYTISYDSNLGRFWGVANLSSGEYFYVETTELDAPCDGWVEETTCDSISTYCGGIDAVTRSFTRTFTAEDSCGNVGSCSVTYTWHLPILYRNQGSSISESTPSVSNAEEKIDFKAYPVPFDTEVTISYEFDYRTDVTIELFDTKGLMVSSVTNDRYVAGSTGRTKIDLSKTPSQVLYVKLTTSRGTVTKKIVSSGR